MHGPPEAFVLLTIPNTTLKGSQSEAGALNLECVTIPNPQSGSNPNRDVYLVLRINKWEIPLDPNRIVNRNDYPGIRTYTFLCTPSDTTELLLTLRAAPPGDTKQAEDLDTFDSILEQYLVQLNKFTPPDVSPSQTSGPSSSGLMAGLGRTSGNKDLRGQLVLVNEETGEVVGEVEEKFRIKEDPSMHEKGHENDPVVIEVPDETTRESDANAFEAFAQLVPPDQQNWMTKSASIISHAISMTTSLLVTTITTASNLYVSHSAPSPHHSGASTPVTSAKGAAGGGTPPPLPPRPRALVFLTSEKTQKGLNKVHAISGEAVKVSSKTVGLIDNMIRRAMGAGPKRQKYFPHGGPAINLASSSYLTPNTVGGPPLPPRSPSPSLSTRSAPPPYSFGDRGQGALGDYKSPLPARSTSPAPPVPPRTNAGTPLGQAADFHPAQPRLTTKDRILISADLILSTIDDSTRRVLDTGTVELGKVVGHKYGPEAAQSSLLMAGTARNVGLVYVDMRGIGRRALLKRAGKTFVKSQISSKSAASRAAPPDSKLGR